MAGKKLTLLPEWVGQTVTVFGAPTVSYELTNDTPQEVLQLLLEIEHPAVTITTTKRDEHNEG